MIRLLLVDDQNLIREGLKAMLELEPDLQVIGCASNGQLALEQVATLLPDVVLMDVRMPVMDGREATRLIRDRFPDTKVLVLSTFDDDQYISDAMKAGAKGYLLKDMPSDELAQAIRLLHSGYTQFAPGLFEKLMNHAAEAEESPSPQLSKTFLSLTPREQDVLKLIADGSTNRDIANQLYISEGTVKSHVTHLLSRLNLRNRAQLAIYAHANFREAENKGSLSYGKT
jgi:DNA-binding NarL/FixJ family response regulator